MATLTVRIDNKLHDEVEQSADFNGLSIADYIRETLSERVQDEQE
jgi:predicted HicB family RNase H-like nuclease